MLALVLAACLMQAPPAPPPHLASAWQAFNAGRRRIGRPEFVWSGQLAAAAQEQADRVWCRATRGQFRAREDIHWDLAGRIRRSGWAGTYSESGPHGDAAPDPVGYAFPAQSAEALARRHVWIVLDSNIAPYHREGHVADFRGGWPYAGLGYRGGALVIVYGAPPAPAAVPGNRPHP
jgi:hypothetical protein